MSFAGAVLACWLAIATVAFVVLSALARRGGGEEIEADLGIVGAGELRILLGERYERRVPPEARLAYLGAPSTPAAREGVLGGYAGAAR
jgi:hypothetical protein